MADKSEMKQCPFCAELIRAEAVKCRFCGEYLDTELARLAEKAVDLTSEAGAEQGEPGDDVVFAGSPSLWAITGSLIRGVIFIGVGLLLVTYSVERIVNDHFNLGLTESQLAVFGRYRFYAGVLVLVFTSFVVFLKALKLKMTYYEVTPDRIEWSRGILDRRVDNLDMFRIVDLKLRRSLFDCLVGVGTVMLETSDKSDPEFVFRKVHGSRILYDVIKKASLDADKKSGVVHLE